MTKVRRRQNKLQLLTLVIHHYHPHLKMLSSLLLLQLFVQLSTSLSNQLHPLVAAVQNFQQSYKLRMRRMTMRVRLVARRKRIMRASLAWTGQRTTVVEPLTWCSIF
ncbi:hypothetical protein LINPERPRIM_LOCUS2539, partial [Linum perenne]